MARETRLNMIDKFSEEVSLSRQFRLFSIPKSSYYYNSGRVGIDKNCYIKKAYEDSIAILHEDRAALRHDYQYAPFNGKVTMIFTPTVSEVSDGGSLLQITKTG
jgi:hypothetical protein